MMTPNIRVSILERLVPSIAFIVAALSGAVGGVMLIRLFNLLRESESAGYAAIFDGVSEIELAVGAVLVFAAVLCAIGILVSIIRLFTTNETASPPGLLFLMTGLLSLVPPFAIHYMLHVLKEAVRTPDSGGVGAIAATVADVAYLAIGSAGVIALLLLALPFIPFSSRRGRKSSPLVCLIVVEIIFATLIGIYFWEARKSIAERDKDRTTTSPEILDPQNYNGDRGIIASPPDNRYNSPAGTNSNSRFKTISGGVLNSKAIELPQPEYPPVARAVKASGQVSVQVLVDENGQVISAVAVAGHPLLRAAAVQAARKAKFKPSGQQNITGVLTYTFTEQ